MKLAWVHPRLEVCCVSGARLRALVGAQLDAATDLLHLVAQAPYLRDLMTFACVGIDVAAGSLILSIEEVDMYARPLGSDGEPSAVHDRRCHLLYLLRRELLALK